MQDFKKIIEENRSLWDQHELPEGHEERFLNRLDSIGKSRKISINWKLTFRVAASVLLMFSIVWIMVEPFKSGQASSRVHDITISPEMEKVMSYYDSQSQRDAKTIMNLSNTNQATKDIEITARHQLQKLEAQLVMIQKDLEKNPGNESVKAALVNAQKKKSEIMNCLKDYAQEVAAENKTEK